MRGIGSSTSFTLAVGKSAVWVADDGANAVLRIDPRRMRRAAVVRCSGALVRRDPKTLRPAGRIEVPRASGITLGFGSVWLVTGDRVLRVDQKTLRIVASIAVRGTSAAIGVKNVWVLSMGNGVRGNVTKIDPRTNRVVGRSIPIVPKP